MIILLFVKCVNHYNIEPLFTFNCTLKKKKKVLCSIQESKCQDSSPVNMHHQTKTQQSVMSLCHFPRSDWNARHMEVFWERSPRSWVMFWSCCDPVDQAGSMYLRVDRAEVGQHEAGNKKRGELCQSNAPVTVCPLPHLPPDPLLIPLQSFRVMRCCGRATGTSSCSDGIKESLVWVTAGRTCQGTRSGEGPRVSIKLISRGKKTPYSD